MIESFSPTPELLFTAAMAAGAGILVGMAFSAWLGQQRKGEMRDELVEETQNTEKVIGSSLSISAGFSVGYVIWLARSGILLSSVLSSLPAWRFIDPLPVLGALQSGNGEDDGESLESMVEAGTAEESGEQDPPGDRENA